VKCPSAKCGSSNVEHLPHYWESLPSDSPLKGRYAPPAAVEAQYVLVLGVIAVGIALMATSSVLLGLLAAAGGLVWGAVMQQRVARWEAAHGAWSTSMICLACTGRWVP
jgi:hypothetical protein